MNQENNQKISFDVLPEFTKIWPELLKDFEKIYNPEEYPAPFLSLVDMVMSRCKEKDESEYKMFEYIDCANHYLQKETKTKFISILIEDGIDFVVDDEK